MYLGGGLTLIGFTEVYLEEEFDNTAADTVPVCGYIDNFNLQGS